MPNRLFVSVQRSPVLPCVPRLDLFEIEVTTTQDRPFMQLNLLVKWQPSDSSTDISPANLRTPDGYQIMIIYTTSLGVTHFNSYTFAAAFTNVPPMSEQPMLTCVQKARSDNARTYELCLQHMGLRQGLEF